METATDVLTRALCYSASVFGVSAATYIPQQDWSEDFYSNSLFTIPNSFRGGSGVISPMGEYVAGPAYDKETIVYGDIDLKDVDRRRTSVNLTGLYSRWDLINISVRQGTYEPVVPMETKGGITGAPEARPVEDLGARIRQLEEQIATLLQRDQEKKR